MRVVGCGWQEVVERCLGPGSMADNGGQAGRKEADQYIHRGFGRTKNKIKQSTFIKARRSEGQTQATAEKS